MLYQGSYESIFLYSIVPYLLNFILILSYPETLDRSLERAEKTKRERIGSAIRMLFELLKKPKVLKIIYSSAALQPISE